MDEVHAERRRAADQHLRAGRDVRRRHVALADAPDEVHRALLAGVTVPGRADLQRAAVGVEQVGLPCLAGRDADRRGDRLRQHLGLRAQLGDQSPLGGDHRRVVGAALAMGVDDDLVRGERAGPLQLKRSLRQYGRCAASRRRGMSRRRDLYDHSMYLTATPN
jgi:hypothetical protein